MLVQDLISLSMRASGILGVGQSALAQDLTDCQNLLMLMMMQWRQKRWLVFRLDTVDFPIVTNQGTYTVGPSNPSYAPVPPAPPPDVAINGNYRPASVQTCYLRLNAGLGQPSASYPVDFPMRILRSREEYDAIRLKALQSWPSVIFYDTTIPYGTLYIWPIPIQANFAFHIGFQQAIDMAAEGAQNVELTTLLPAETQMAIMYNLALEICVNFKLPPDQQLQSAARATLNVLRQTNFALQPLTMPSALISRGGRIKNPAAGFYPEVSATVPYTVLS